MVNLDGKMKMSLMVSGGLESKDNKLMIREWVEWMICYSYGKHLPPRLLPAVNQFAGSGRKGISDCKCVISGHLSGKQGRLKQF